MTDIVITKGDTFSFVWQIATDVFTYKPITGITNAAPARITCAGHGLPADWPVAVISAKGMTEINAAFPPKTREFHIATVIDPNTVELNDVNSADYSAYVSGGYLMFYHPADLTGFFARGQIKDKVGGVVLLDLTANLVIDTALATVTATESATTTAALTWSKGVFDIEIVSPSLIVEKIDTGKFSVATEITT